jgi:hypothetical protein
MNQIVTQGVGGLALFFAVLSPQFKKRSLILLSLIAGLILWVVHYSLLNAWTGSVMNAIEAAAVCVSFQKDTKTWAQWKLWPYVFAVAYVSTGIATGISVVNFLPIVAQVIAVVAVWQIKPRRIRLLSLLPRPLWFVYNLIVGSYAGILAELFITISIVAGIIRHDLKEKSVTSKGAN